MRDLWHEYKEKYPVPIDITKEKKSRFDDFLDFQPRSRHADELDQYLSLPCELAPNPILWWRTHKESYPTLSRLAFDLLGVPAMSSECERTFSKAGISVTEERNRISAVTVQSGECLKSWSSQKIIQIVTKDC